MQKEIVCHHEAGHAIVAHKLGVEFSDLIIERKKGPGAPQWGDWEGIVGGISSKRTKVLDVRCIALGGPLAEAKFQARRSLTKPVFDSPDSWGDFVSKVLDWKEGTIKVDVGFLDCGNQHRIPIEIFDEDLRQLKGKSLSKVSLRDALKRTIDILDKPNNWDLLKAVGEALSNSKPTEVKRVRWNASRFEEFVRQRRRSD